jgi:hypothetical protein
MNQQSGSFEFQLEELAQKLPMSGDLYPSQIIERLRPTLEELKAKKLFNSEIFRSKGKHFLRLIPLNQDEYLVGVESLPRFSTFIEQVYGKTIHSVFSVSDDDIYALLKKYPRVVDFKKRKYSWVYHVLSVLMHQMVKNGYQAKAKDPSALIAYAMKRDEIDLPVGFKPVDLVGLELIRDEQKDNLVQTRQQEELKIEQNFKDIAEAYYGALSEKQLQEYELRIRKKFGTLMRLEKNSDSYVSMIKDHIIDDMKTQRLDIDKLKLAQDAKLQ